MKSPTAPSPIRVLLCDDHYLVREGISSCLVDYPAVTIVGEAADGHSALKKIEELNPDVVLMDVNMPGMNGLEATRIATKRFPGARVIALTVHDNREYVSEIMRSGASGYVLKNTSPEQLVRAIKAVHKGGTYFSAAVSQILLDDSPGEKAPALSEREKQILKLIANGHSNTEIAQDLNMPARTVESTRARLMKKLEARTGADLSRIAGEHKMS